MAKKKITKIIECKKCKYSIIKDENIFCLLRIKNKITTEYANVNNVKECVFYK